MRISSILLNLLSNAYKFTPEGGSITLVASDTTYKDDAASGDESQSTQFTFVVRDTGIGMSPEFAQKVFEPFEREQTVSGIQGTGLGMAITKKVVDLMGGTITVVSAIGEGTEFTVRVPLELAEPQVTAAEHTEEDVDLTGKRVLLADDNEINREIATIVLEGLGLEVTTVSSGQESLDMLASGNPHDFDIILMDVQMPGIDGYETTRRIRAMGRADLEHIPIVAVTANAFDEDKRMALESGMDAHMTKPLNVNEIERVLISLL